jgi:dihydroneopterin aldolase
VKLGGSHAFSDHLTEWVAAIAGCAGEIVVVPGGGPFADAVREAQPKMGFPDAAAHHMALLAMEQYGCALASLNGAFVPADSPGAIGRALDEKRVPVWMPSRMALAAKDIPCSWDVTSDSLAAWLANQLGARQLLLVKHVSLAGTTIRLADLIARGIIDTAFADFLKNVPAAMLGPADQGSLATIIACGAAAGTRIDP